MKTCKTCEAEKANSIIWNPVVGYEGLYEVSNTGLIMSVQRTTRYIKGGRNAKHIVRARLRTLVLGRRGYYVVNMSSAEGVKKSEYVHRIVGRAFLASTYQEGLVINHKDGNRLNNHADNLEWVTQGENLKHSWNVLGNDNSRFTSLWAGKHGKDHIRSRPVISVNLETGVKKLYESAASAVKEGFTRTSIGRVCRGQKNQHKGHHWFYAQEDKIQEKLK